jgi:carbon storage regulator
MLVLSRKVGQRIVIAGDIGVTVLDVKGNRIRLGIDAPEDVAIQRGEIAFEFPPAAPSGSDNCAAARTD